MDITISERTSLRRNGYYCLGTDITMLEQTSMLDRYHYVLTDITASGKTSLRRDGHHCVGSLLLGELGMCTGRKRGRLVVPGEGGSS